MEHIIYIQYIYNKCKYSSNIITSFVYKSFSDTQVTRKVSDTSNLAVESVKTYLLQCICPHILHIISSTASTCT